MSVEILIVGLFWLGVFTFLFWRIAVAGKDRADMRKRRDFESIFRFEVPVFHAHRLSPDEARQLVKELQQKVDEKLKELAAAFARADLAERKVRAEAGKAKEEAKSKLEAKAVAKAYEGRIEYTQEVLRTMKDAFWAAHGLAKWAGFLVWPSYKSYLPDDLLAEVMEKGLCGKRRRRSPRPGPPNPTPGPKPPSAGVPRIEGPTSMMEWDFGRDATNE